MRKIDLLDMFVLILNNSICKYNKYFSFDVIAKFQ